MSIRLYRFYGDITCNAAINGCRNFLFRLHFNELQNCLPFYLKRTFPNFVNYVLFFSLSFTVLSCFPFRNNDRISN
jgi:hypothetical protein